MPCFGLFSTRPLRNGYFKQSKWTEILWEWSGFLPNSSSKSCSNLNSDPLFTYFVYPFINRFFVLTPLRKIGIGFFLVVPSFLIPAWLEYRIGLGETPGIGWQLLSYLILTTAEVMISVTCLEFSYTQAPRAMKSLVFGLFMASVAVGNLFTSLVNLFILNEDGSSKLDGPEYYLFFAGAMLVTAIIFIPIARVYPEKSYLHD